MTAPGFIASTQLRLTCGGGVGRIQVIEFDVAQFIPEAYESFRLERPIYHGRSTQKRLAEHFFGRLAARYALLEEGLPVGPLRIGPDRAPMWPAGVVGSITHSDRYAAACAASSASLRGIGIDIEHSLSMDMLASVEELALSAEEIKLIRHEKSCPYPLLLATAFSAKESIYKAVFPTIRRYFGFEAIAIDHWDVKNGWLGFTTQETLCNEWTSGLKGRVNFTFINSATTFTQFSW